MKKCLALN